MYEADTYLQVWSRFQAHRDIQLRNQMNHTQNPMNLNGKTDLETLTAQAIAAIINFRNAGGAAAAGAAAAAGVTGSVAAAGSGANAPGPSDPNQAGALNAGTPRSRADYMDTIPMWDSGDRELLLRLSLIHI